MLALQGVGVRKGERTTAAATLRRQYLHVLRGADRTHGPHIADLQAAYIARAQQETGWTFAGFVARLIETWAAENAR